MIDNCPKCGLMREHVGVLDIPELKRRNYLAHCMTEGCEQKEFTYTYKTVRDEQYYTDRIELLRQLGIKIDTINKLSERTVKARRAYEITVNTSKGASKPKGERWEMLLDQLRDLYDDTCKWSDSMGITRPPVPEGMRQ